MPMTLSHERIDWKNSAVTSFSSSSPHYGSPLLLTESLRCSVVVFFMNGRLGSSFFASFAEKHARVLNLSEVVFMCFCK